MRRRPVSLVIAVVLSTSPVAIAAQLSLDYPQW
jgi:hypothetical protein